MEEPEAREPTVVAIMRRAGMRSSGFYHYFANLDALLIELLDHLDRDIRDVVDPWVANPAPIADYRTATVDYLTAMFAVMHRHRGTVRAVTQAANSSAVVYDRWQSHALGYYIEETRKFIERQVKAGRSQVADPARVANALILMNHSVWFENMRRDKPDDPAALGRVIGGMWNDVIFGPDPGAQT